MIRTDDLYTKEGQAMLDLLLLCSVSRVAFSSIKFSKPLLYVVVAKVAFGTVVHPAISAVELQQCL